MNTTGRITIIGQPTESLPIGIRNHRLATNQHTGKADPTWDVAFRPKWNKTEVSDELPTPKGYTKPFGLNAYLDRVEEIRELAKTQHLDLAPTDLELNQNLSLNDELNAAEIAEKHCGRVPYWPDPATLINTRARIDWERYQFACGRVTKYRLTQTEDGRFGIEEVGARVQSRDALRQMAARFREAGCLAGDPGDLYHDRARVAYHNNQPVLAACDPDQLVEARTKSGDYAVYTSGYGDDDPTRDAVHTTELNDKFAKPSNGGSMADLGFDDPEFPSPAVMYEDEDGTVSYG